MTSGLCSEDFNASAKIDSGTQIWASESLSPLPNHSASSPRSAGEFVVFEKAQSPPDKRKRLVASVTFALFPSISMSADFARKLSICHKNDLFLPQNTPFFSFASHPPHPLHPTQHLFSYSLLGSPSPGRRKFCFKNG